MSVLKRSKTVLHAVRCAATRASLLPSQVVEVDTEENDIINPKFTNRNPRNLERLKLAVKDRGWGTMWPSQQYWHRLRLERSQKHVTACVEHSSGKVVVSVSTREWAVKKHLYNTRDVMACENVGRLLAQRCLEAGITYMMYIEIPWVVKSEAVERFRNAMKEGGMVLNEPRRIYE
uniref:Large ribosomal subunit protein uL18m n=1 Tax=Leptobrachium leishanense TaxID=445787 RepID=A0A8C5QQA9_9ANUR